MEDVFKNFKPEGKDYEVENQEKTIEALKDLRDTVETRRKDMEDYKDLGGKRYELSLSILESVTRKAQTLKDVDTEVGFNESKKRLNDAYLNFLSLFDQDKNLVDATRAVEELMLEENLEKLPYPTKKDELNRYLEYVTNLVSKSDEIINKLPTRDTRLEKQLEDIIKYQKSEWGI